MQWAYSTPLLRRGPFGPQHLHVCASGIFIINDRSVDVIAHFGTRVGTIDLPKDVSNRCHQHVCVCVDPRSPSSHQLINTRQRLLFDLWRSGSKWEPRKRERPSDTPRVSFMTVDPSTGCTYEYNNITGILEMRNLGGTHVWAMAMHPCAPCPLWASPELRELSQQSAEHRVNMGPFCVDHRRGELYVFPRGSDIQVHDSQSGVLKRTLHVDRLATMRTQGACVINRSILLTDSGHESCVDEVDVESGAYIGAHILRTPSGYLSHYQVYAGRLYIVNANGRG